MLNFKEFCAEQIDFDIDTVDLRNPPRFLKWKKEGPQRIERRRKTQDIKDTTGTHTIRLQYLPGDGRGAKANYNYTLTTWNGAKYGLPTEYFANQKGAKAEANRRSIIIAQIENKK